MVVEKVVNKELSQYCKDNFKLHPRQMRDRRERSTINAVTILVYIV